MAHLLAGDAGMTVLIGCPDRIGPDNGRRVLSDFYRQPLGWPRYDAYGTPFLTRTAKFRVGFDDDGWSDTAGDLIGNTGGTLLQEHANAFQE